MRSGQTIAPPQRPPRWIISGYQCTMPMPPTVEQIVQGLAWIEQRVCAGQKVYIHCAAGMGRSVTLLACWYLYTGSMSVPQVSYVRQKTSTADCSHASAGPAYPRRWPCS